MLQQIIRTQNFSTEQYVPGTCAAAPSCCFPDPVGQSRHIVCRSKHSFSREVLSNSRSTKNLSTLEYPLAPRNDSQKQKQSFDTRMSSASSLQSLNKKRHSDVTKMFRLHKRFVQECFLLSNYNVPRNRRSFPSPESTGLSFGSLGQAIEQ